MSRSPSCARSEVSRSCRTIRGRGQSSAGNVAAGTAFTVRSNLANLDVTNALRRAIAMSLIAERKNSLLGGQLLKVRLWRPRLHRRSLSRIHIDPNATDEERVQQRLVSSGRTIPIAPRLAAKLLPGSTTHLSQTAINESLMNNTIHRVSAPRTSIERNANTASSRDSIGSRLPRSNCPRTSVEGKPDQNEQVAPRAQTQFERHLNAPRRPPTNGQLVRSTSPAPLRLLF